MSMAISSKSTGDTKAQPTRRKTSKKAKISEDEIRILAYNFYERRSANGAAGDATSDWIEAERQLLEK